MQLDIKRIRVLQMTTMMMTSTRWLDRLQRRRRSLGQRRSHLRRRHSAATPTSWPTAISISPKTCDWRRGRRHHRVITVSSPNLQPATAHRP